MVKVYPPYRLSNVVLGKGTYISKNSIISYTSIGKFCSIGPNLLCGWGLHPLECISTSPYFYSNKKQNGYTLSQNNLIEDRKNIIIGNDVFIGANVTILDGVKIGDGAVIGAGAVVSKDIPDYAIAYGVPIEIKRYRFNKNQILKLQKLKWWEFDDKGLEDVNKMFFNIDDFLDKYDDEK
ncbi:CatB-related O-acetyltransferase [Winogradskyella echinorum]|uniref:CatB-related O-acetyltransferase n=2 Tax=Winogradskyella echinorum TaxID=538189 RepID=A0ABR6Y2P5_9FLAO|nr:CatB-related O-acetyltransferase [Winogradskyella echinorum]MBC5751297.1 CatB-related O-acetyltransferase [Winogradskyella echinorum]